MTRILPFLVTVLILLTLSGCTNHSTQNQEISSQPDVPFIPNDRWTTWWHDGKAEVSSFDLVQARYGELRYGDAVMVFVTEPFSKSLHVKSDRPEANPSDIIEVMKMNFVRKFNTGIYPYSILTSTFTPVDGTHSLKNSMSAQEWCGHVFSQMDLTDQGYQFVGHSYFESDGEGNELIPWQGNGTRYFLEDEVWSLIRMDPDILPHGKVMMVPPLSFLRLMHLEVRPYEAECSKYLRKNDPPMFTITYPELNRTLSIEYEEGHPYRILKWSETYPDGWSEDAPALTSTGTLRKTIRTDYWNQHAVSDSVARKELGF